MHVGSISTAMDLDEIQELIGGSARAYEEELWRVNKHIHENPEPHYEETQAHDTICDLLENSGYDVTRHAYGLSTAFQAEFGKGGGLVSYNAEYDALPCESEGYHHACGHNHIATSSIAAFLFTADMLKRTEIKGRVRLLGTPAEESGGEKIDLIEAGAYRGVDASLMAHPYSNIECGDGEAHAAAAPWEGINALDAVVAAYNNISMLRQQLPLTQRVHGIISNGGERPNVIPGLTTMELYARAATDADLEILCKRLESCILAGAQASGCQVECSWDRAYKNLQNSETIAEVFTKSMKIIGRDFKSKSDENMGGSTDQGWSPFNEIYQQVNMADLFSGNVTHQIPGIHPLFLIPTPEGREPHTPRFATAAGTYGSFLCALDTGKGLAAAGYQLLADPDLRQKAWSEHLKK
ncbi:uncharacterized protein N7483_000621 [Penicillium malachiteum]|uniref:uncharacterized protein n=1 Tax=Penicillium malachiteum TaxID=1324776 RepID=UPI002546A31A|nr:uncharacterized protein N7483_000621 [Penicillium malachiteum]KAJ5735496.1 hypothetical protein N7483_000621 [Penicillium malachiteum]